MQIEDAFKASFEKGDYEEALLTLQKGIKIYTPSCIWHNMGLCYQKLHQYAKAIDAYLKAIPLNENSSQTYWNLSYCYLINGNFLEGFRCQEYRLKTCKKNPGWQGENISGKTLVVLRDGGFGDSIQFLRYIPLLKAHHCKVFVDMQPELLCLFDHLVSPNFNLIPASEEIVYVHMMSLPYCFKTELHTIPPPAKIRCRLSPKKNRVGICWQGGKDNVNDKTRSLPLESLIPLLEVSGIQYVCIQKEISEKEKAILSHYHVLQPSISSFLDTVKIIEECECVISICSSMAHLSATMGVPTWVLLAYNHCWRWLNDRLDSPWYPSVRLYRQKVRGDWEGLIKAVAEQLKK